VKVVIHPKYVLAFYGIYTGKWYDAPKYSRDCREAVSMQDDNLSIPSDYGQDNRIVDKLTSDAPDEALYRHFREQILGRLARCTDTYHKRSPYLQATSAWGAPVVTPRSPSLVGATSKSKSPARLAAMSAEPAVGHLPLTQELVGAATEFDRAQSCLIEAQRKMEIAAVTASGIAQNIHYTKCPACSHRNISNAIFCNLNNLNCFKYCEILFVAI
jgi:hypothetical protein